MNTLSRALFAALAIGVAAPAAAAEAAKEARIHFVDHGGIRDWRVVDRDTLLIRARGNQWYKAELFMPAYGLPFAHAIGFDTGVVGSFDRFSSIIVRGQRYPLRSLVKVEAPPRRGKADA